LGMRHIVFALINALSASIEMGMNMSSGFFLGVQQ